MIGLERHSPGARRLRVRVAAEDPLVRAGLAALLREAEGFEVAEEAGQGRDSGTADVALIDQHGAGALDGIDAEGRTPALILVDGPAQAEAAQRAGALGILARESGAAEIVAGLRAVAAGLMVVSPEFEPRAIHSPMADEPGETLTPRESEILEGLSTGASNRAIAHHLGIRESTVKFHVNSILSKLGAQSRTEAVAIALRRGLLRI